MNTILLTKLILTQFDVEIYTTENEQAGVNINYINGLFNLLDNEQYPKGILEILDSISGIYKILIFDKNSTLLVNSEIVPLVG
jgi:hypothetical protein